MWKLYETEAELPVSSIFIKITMKIFLGVLIALLTCLSSQMYKNGRLQKDIKCNYLCPFLQYPAIYFWDSLSCFHGNPHWGSPSTLAAFENIDPSFSFSSIHTLTHKHMPTQRYICIHTDPHTHTYTQTTNDNHHYPMHLYHNIPNGIKTQNK